MQEDSTDASVGKDGSAVCLSPCGGEAAVPLEGGVAKEDEDFQGKSGKLRS